MLSVQWRGFIRVIEDCDQDSQTDNVVFLELCLKEVERGKKGPLNALQTNNFKTKSHTGGIKMKHFIALAIAYCCMASCSYATEFDNTKQNAIDHNIGRLTAQNQSNSKVSLRETTELRKAIMRTKGLSINAQNVKIITDANGFLTLRGPVDSLHERNVIDNLAKRCFGGALKNELQVKTKK